MAEDFSELIQYLDQKFSKIDESFVFIEKELENKTDKSDVNNLINAVDAYTKKADAYFQEMVIFSSVEAS